MTPPIVAPFGSWQSPISAGTPHWVEVRPQEGGRSVLMRMTDRGPEEALPSGFSVRSRVHEYGGGGALRRQRGYARRAPDLCSRDPRRPRCDQRDRRPARPWKRSPADDPLGPRFLRLAAPFPRWPAPRLAHLGSSSAPLGGVRTLGGGARPRRLGRGGAAGGGGGRGGGPRP